jgi:hypothetical protein
VAAVYDLVYADWDAQVERLVAVMNGRVTRSSRVHGRAVIAAEAV